MIKIVRLIQRNCCVTCDGQLMDSEGISRISNLHQIGRTLNLK